MTDDNISRAAVEAALDGVLDYIGAPSPDESGAIEKALKAIRSLPPSPVEGEGPRKLNTGSDQILRRWIIYREPGCVPLKKMPPDQTHNGVLAFLRVMKQCHAEGTKYAICNLTWDHDLWVDDGDLELAVYPAALSPQSPTGDT